MDNHGAAIRPFHPMAFRRKKYDAAYRLTLRWSLVIALSLVIAFLHILPKRFAAVPQPIKPVVFEFTVEEIPVTHQSGRRAARPVAPSIPIPTEEPDLPQDAALIGNTFDFGAGLEQGRPQTAKQDTIPPRPLVQVLPEYSKELQKMRVQGNVRLLLLINERGRVEHAVVLENTTGSRDCETAAIEAAQKSTFAPATVNGTPVAMWLASTFSFQPDDKRR
ncbi:MAG: TonB family protein [candidate division KSB1 bacterium]|nr:TonB family protein [candidate division KSB1 bacterium]